MSGRHATAKQRFWTLQVWLSRAVVWAVARRGMLSRTYVLRLAEQSGAAAVLGAWTAWTAGGGGLTRAALGAAGAAGLRAAYGLAVKNVGDPEQPQVL